MPKPPQKQISLERGRESAREVMFLGPAPKQAVKPSVLKRTTSESVELARADCPPRGLWLLGELCVLGALSGRHAGTCHGSWR